MSNDFDWMRDCLVPAGGVLPITPYNGGELYTISIGMYGKYAG